MRDKYIINDNQVFEWYEDPLFQGYVAVPLPKSPPWVGYHGPKIPMEEWRKILAFFRWSYDESKSETQVRLYFHPAEGLWRAWAFPQEYGSGMTTKELPEDNCDERRRAGIGSGWLVGGTVHHHCSSKAFQSGTDKSNEETQNGIHITVGQIDKSFHDLHGRVSFKKHFYEAAWSEWFELPPGLDGLPSAFHDEVTEYFLCEANDNPDGFPAEWKANLIKKVWVSQSNPGWWKGENNSAAGTEADWTSSTAAEESRLQKELEANPELEATLADASLQLDAISEKYNQTLSYLIWMIDDKSAMNKLYWDDDDKAMVAEATAVLEKSGVKLGDVEIYAGV
jgi:hypothetical protein